MQTVLVCYEDLAASEVGCYGSALAVTPHFDELAANSVVWDHCYVRDLRDPSHFLRECIKAESHAIVLGNHHNLPGDVGSRGDATDHAVFDAAKVITALEQAARSNAQTALVIVSASTVSTQHLIAVGSSALSQVDWSRLDQKIWTDAEFTNQFQGHLTSQQELHDIYRRAMVHQYDCILGELRSRLQPERWIVTAMAGVANAPIDWIDSLSPKRTHVPLLECETRRRSHTARRQDLMTTSAIFTSGVREPRPHVRLESAEAIAIRTREWIFVDGRDSNSEPALFQQPDDRWQVLNVAAQFPDVVDQFLTEFSVSLQ